MLAALDADAVEARKKSRKSAKTEQAVSELQAQVERLNAELAASRQREQNLLSKGQAVAKESAQSSGSGIASEAVPAESTDQTAEPKQVADEDTQKTDL